MLIGHEEDNIVIQALVDSCSRIIDTFIMCYPFFDREPISFGHLNCV